MVEKKRKPKKKPLKKTDESDGECLARLKKQVSEDSTDEESEATRRAKSLADSPQAGLCRKGSQKNIGACVHTLELTRPFYSCVGLCACAFPNPDLDEWKKVYGMIPLMTPDDLDLFKGRLKKVDMTALWRRPPVSRRAAARGRRAPRQASDETGKTLLWQASYYNDLNAVAALQEVGYTKAQTMIKQQDAEFYLSPLDLAMLQEDKTLFDLLQGLSPNAMDNPYYGTGTGLQWAGLRSS